MNMMTPAPPTAHRLQNFKRILKERFGNNMAAFARALEKPDTYVWQLANNYRDMGEKTARGIERKLGLPAGELDQHPRKSFPIQTSVLFRRGTDQALEVVLCPVLPETEVLREYLSMLSKIKAANWAKSIDAFVQDAVLELRPAPVPCDTRSYYVWGQPGIEGAGVSRLDLVLVDPAYSEPVDGWVMLIDSPDWQGPKMRVCQVRNGKAVFTLDRGADPIPLGRGVAIVGAVCLTSRDLRPGPHKAAPKK